MNGIRYTRKKDYYRQVTHEFNTPAGWTCPHAAGCLTKADRETGKRVQTGPEYVCYAAVAERFPSVRGTRWANFEAAKVAVRSGAQTLDVPSRATHVRIHGSGDFFSQAYFDLWLRTAAAHPDVQFWAFTKSLPYWVARLDDVPDNLELQASLGGKHDELALIHELKTAEVFREFGDVPATLPIDVDDWHAQQPGGSFALLDNFGPGATPEAITEHNERAYALTGSRPDGDLA